MADPKHVQLVKKGANAIKEWRQNHPKQTLNLRKANLLLAKLPEANLTKACLSEAELSFALLLGAELSETDLFGAILSGASLIHADLSGADLHDAKLDYANLLGADLHDANLSGINSFETEFQGANLSGANFSDAKLGYANLTFADLSKTDFSNSDLTGVKFVCSKMSDTKLTGAKMVNTTFGTCNLAECIGLETVRHLGPSNTDFRTLKWSFFSAGSCFTSGLETFFLNSGLPKELLETLPTILAEVQYCSSFVCYGQPDLKFAERLVKDLKAKGVSCWLYSMDATPGKRVWGEITQRRRQAEKMIVICSSNALVREGVKKEIEEQIDEEPNKIIPVSCDNLWKEKGFSIKRGEQDLKPFLLQRNYADFVDESEYETSLKKLLKGLKLEEN